MIRFVGIVLAFAFALAAAPAGAARIAAFAGSGAAGFEDGPSATASFLMPEGLAIDAQGNLYVADTAAQRIRRVTPAGLVTTLAGSGRVDASRLWVPGGYRDGAAAAAQFDQPVAVAVGSDNAVIVADRANHCLRAIQNGSVSTYAGTCTKAGSADGTRATALFTAPTALAYDSDGTLFVGDFGVGIRKVASDGTVTTLPVDATIGKYTPTVTGLSVAKAGSTTILYAAVQEGVLAIDAHAAKILWYFKDGVPNAVNDGSAYVEGMHDFGYPYALTSPNGYWFVYTDIVTNAVRSLSGSYTNVEIGQPVDNARYEAGGFRDGGTEARVNQPMGIVQRSDGSFYVADTGNRRIRLISGVSEVRHGTSQQETTQDLTAAAHNDYRIVLAGNSTVSYDQAWDQSVAGILEKKLRENWKALGFPRPPRVYPIQLISDLNAVRDYVDNYLASGLADMVVLQVNSGEVYGLVGQTQPTNIAGLAPKWQPQVTSDVRSMASELSHARIPFVVAIAPMPFEISPVESSDVGVYKAAPSPPGDYAQQGPLLRQAVENANVPYVDEFGAFWGREMLPDHPELFSTIDYHFSVEGAALDAQLILDELLKTKPWAGR